MPRPIKEVLENREEFEKLISDVIDKPSAFAKMFLDLELFPYNIEYADSTERWIIYRAGAKVGKTTSTAVKAIHFAWFAPYLHKRVKDRCEIIIVAPTQAQANIMFGTIKDLVHRSKLLEQFIIRETASELEIAFIFGTGTTKIFTRAAGDRGDSLRGYIPHVIIMDEAAFIREEVFKAILPRGAATEAKVWLVSTPFGMSGYFYQASVDSRPTNPVGTYKEFRAKTLDNPYAKNDPTYMEQMKKLTRDEYVMEFEGEFIQEGDVLIPIVMIRNAIKDFRIPDSARFYLGVDVARSGRDETIYTVIAVDNDNRVYVVHTGAERQSNLVDVVGKINEFCSGYRIESVFVDETGLGGGVVDLCHRQNLPVRGVTFSLQEKAKLYKNIRLLFENSKIYLRNISALVFQLSCLKREYTPTGDMKIVSEEHDDYPASLALACRAVDSGDTWHVLEGGIDIFG